MNQSLSEVETFSGCVDDIAGSVKPLGLCAVCVCVYAGRVSIPVCMWVCAHAHRCILLQKGVGLWGKLFLPEGSCFAQQLVPESWS